MSRNRAWKSNRGVALLVVLWACTLLAILLGGYALSARTEGLQAHYQFEYTRAYYAAEAGLMRAVYALSLVDRSKRWMADGRVYRFNFDDAKLSVSIVSDDGKVNLNLAPLTILAGLFRAVGENPGQADILAKAVVEWRTPHDGDNQDGMRKRAYTDQGRRYAPRGGLFRSVQELQMVRGMTPALYAKVAPLVTIWSKRSIPDRRTAPPLVLAALPGMTPDEIRMELAGRAKNPRYGGRVNSIRAVATLAHGVRAVLNATVKLKRRDVRGRGFVVLQWQAGDKR